MSTDGKQKNPCRRKVSKPSQRVGWFLCPGGATGFRPGFQPGFNPGNRPINGSALKGRKLTWINPTRIAPQNEFRVCLAVFFLESPQRIWT
jgi:hypothetical protein